MTNVPDSVREMWADCYRLFDVYYKMPNTEADWMKFWAAAASIHCKYGKKETVMRMLTVIGDMISDRMKADALEAERKALEQNGHPCTLEDMNLF